MSKPSSPHSSPDAVWTPAPPPPRPRNFSEDAFAGYHWHQRWEVFEGVHTPGRNPVGELCDRVGLPRDLRGKRVLDIGAWNGCFSFECERRGAAEVVGYGVDKARQTGFDRLRELLGSRVVRYEEGSVYNLTPERMGRFDVVLFLGVLYHLRYPMVAIDNVYSVTGETSHIETHVMDHCFIPGGKDSRAAVDLASVSPLLSDAPLWQFYRKGELGDDTSNWFGPNIRAVLDAFGSAGFKIEHLSTWGYRAAFRAERLPGPAEHKTLNTYENFGVVEDSIAAFTDRHD